MSQPGKLAGARRTCWSPKLFLGVGVFLATLAVYVLANPGRIDLIDGQIRYEVSMNWLTMGRPVLMDPTIASWSGIRGRRGFTYSVFGPAASVAAMPLVWLGTFYDDPPGEATRFLFSLTTSFFGALAAVVLFLFYVELGVPGKEALAWTGITAFATLMWPASDTCLDNAQHACLVLAALFLGFLSAKHRSPLLAGLAGLVAGMLFTYQEYFALIIPVLGLSTLDWDSRRQDREPGGVRVLARPLRLFLRFDARQALREFKRPTGVSAEEAQAFHRACWRYGLFLLLTLVGVALSLDYNYLRFGSVFENGKLRFEAFRGYPMLGNPIWGLLTLLVSPGKSILLYSPLTILGLAGIRRLWRHRPQIGLIIVATSVILVMFISTFAFAGGDWCWGPRYLTPLVPLWALAFPFVPLKNRRRRDLVTAIVGAGLIVQCLAVSVDNMRFFLERGLADFFWAEDSLFYFKHSALAARPGETLTLIKGPPPTAVIFNTRNYPPTYTVRAPPKGIPRSQAPVWMRRYRVFYVPKPWPIWVWDIPPDQRAINPTALLAGTFGVALLGFTLLVKGLQSLDGESKTVHAVAEEEKTAILDRR